MVQSVKSASVEITFMHGWGFNSQIWQDWTMSSLSKVIENKFERGYFAEANMACPSSASATRILIVHSFGLHMICKDLLKKIDLLVLISSFSNFLTNSSNERVQKKKLAIMRRKFSTHPKEVLADFYSECGINAANHPVLAKFDKLNHDLLETDLELLGTSTFDLNLLSSIPKVVLLHGENDRIVNINQSKMMQSELRNSHLFVIPQGEHALPLLNSRECIALVETMILSILEPEMVKHK